MAGGRPTEWSEELETKAWLYVEEYSDIHGHAFPSVVGLCKVIERGKSTIYDWVRDKKGQFSDIVEAINEEQELVTFNKSMTGDYNSTMAKLLLTKHGYSDKQDNTHSGGDKPIEVSGVQFVGVAVKD
jgi:hypothetical protein